MPRISQDLVKARKTEATEAFKTGASVKAVNDALFAKYGMRMGLKDIYAIRAAVKAEAPVVTKAPEVVTAEVVEASVAV